MHPKGSRPGLFYTTAKVHKLQIGETLNELLFLTLERLHMKQQNS